MSADTVIKTMVETVFNARDPAAAVGLVAEDVVDHSGFPGQPPGLAGMQQRWTMLFDAFPDFTVQIEDLLVDGEFVTARLTGTGTHRGEFFGILATGTSVHFSEINISRVAGGVMVEHWAERDTAGVLMQLGALR